jgi:hypothetical protein
MKKIKALVRAVFHAAVYVFERLDALFDDSLRVALINMAPMKVSWDERFLVTLSSVFDTRHVPWKTARFYSKDLAVCSVFGKPEAIRRSQAAFKIFFTGENTTRTSITPLFREYQGNCVDFVSLSIGFDFMPEHANYLRAPLWLLYMFKPWDTKDAVREKMEKFKTKYPKSRFCALVASHDVSGVRRKIYDALSPIAPVDTGGGGAESWLHNDVRLRGEFGNDKKRYLEQYRFNICPENSAAPGYVTEKLFQSLYSGCAPIYYGWSRDPEPGVINPNIILWYDPEGDNTETVKEIEAMWKNEALYDAFMRQEFFVDGAVDVVHGFLSRYSEALKEVAEQCCLRREQARGQ